MLTVIFFRIRMYLLSHFYFVMFQLFYIKYSLYKRENYFLKRKKFCGNSPLAMELRDIQKMYYIDKLTSFYQLCPQYHKIIFSFHKKKLFLKYK